MKTRLNALTSGVLLLASATAFAASTVDLTVKGLIIPSACTPSFSAGGVIDHGKISAKDLNQDRYTIIGNHTLSMAVNCDAAILFALHSLDNRAASGVSTNYGLGFVNESQKLGWYSLSLRNPVADDGSAMQTIGSYDQGNSWFRENIWEPGMYMSVASVDDDTQPVAVKDLRLDLQVQTVINRADALDLSNEVTVDGSATLEVKYL